MACNICTRQNKSNVFATRAGCPDFQRSSLTRHEISIQHRNSENEVRQAQNFRRANDRAEQRANGHLGIQLSTVLFLAKKMLPLSSFVDQISLLKFNGVDLPSHYVHHDSINEMLDSISDSIEADLMDDLRTAPYIGVVIDESTDVAIYKKLVLTLQYAKNGIVYVKYGLEVELPDGKSQTIYDAIHGWLVENALLQKTKSLGSDGCPVMFGVRNGVGVRLQRDIPELIHTHCVAHKAALVCHNASQHVPRFVTFLDHLTSLFRYFSNSPVRYDKLRMTYSLLMDDNNRGFITLKRPCGTRWLSVHQAVDAIMNDWKPLCTTLEEMGENDAEARGHLNRVRSIWFLGIAAALLDIMPMFTKMSKLFQTDGLTYDRVVESVVLTKDALNDMRNDLSLLPVVSQVLQDLTQTGTYQQTVINLSPNIRDEFIAVIKTFMRDLVENLSERFPQDALDVMSSLNTILNPKTYQPQQQNWGMDQLRFLIGHYNLDEPRILQDWPMYRNLLQLYNGRQQEYKEFIRILATDQNYAMLYPEFVKLAQICK